MQVEDALKSRHAVRDFTDQPVNKRNDPRNRALSSANAVLGQLRALAGVRGDRPVADPNRQGCLDLAAQKVATNPDLKTMSRDDWDARPQKLMKDWGHDPGAFLYRL
jgi:hypothetical protein